MSHNNSLVSEELFQLQKEILAKNPQDVLQFCANYFNNKLQGQRSYLWSQNAKAQAAGINLFPSVDTINAQTNSSNSTSDREPSFKSPFVLKDPHSTHNENVLVGEKSHAVGGGDDNSMFKSNFDLEGSEQAPPTKEEMDSQNPSSKPSRSLSQSQSQSQPQPQPQSQQINTSSFQKIPISFNANRRTSVSAEALNPAKLKTESWKPPQNNLSLTEEENLAKNFQNNFLFKQLDENSKKTVISALQTKHFKKDSVIITQGDEGDFFYIIESGTVDFYVNNAKVNSGSDGSSFGELALMYNSPRAATAIAATDVTLWALDRLTFRRILLEGTFNRRLMYEDFLKSIDIFKSLSEHELSKLADALSTEMYKEGDVIVREGEQGENFYLIESGTCQVSNKKLGDIKKLTKGDYFGELALLKEMPRQATVTATNNVIVATLGKSGFQRLLGPVVDVLKDRDPTKIQDPTA
ncbi:PKAR [Candida oxycetoniae]|uniref:cAMP-dependent protein kinase regulatory subunit n=1 Tax=Candida oxycetoniae TaxID=497107 RepID=A0AAI9SW09_9ASCO|nr:PKAR [Candida oxycetoniae]KAI3403736.2 PKAR [Candida oxycetoniae]